MIILRPANAQRSSSGLAMRCIFKGARMGTGTFRTTAEGFAITSAIVGVMLAALLAQTNVLAFGSFRMMAAVFVAADMLTYISMKAGIIKPPDAWGRQKK